MKNMKITSYAVEKLHDPFGILTGDRFEYYLDIEVSEDDELYREKGLYIKLLYVVEDNGQKIISYGLYENSTEQYLDFELEDDELEIVAAFCKEHLPSK
jgi:hypothetical protein